MRRAVANSRAPPAVDHVDRISHEEAVPPPSCRRCAATARRRPEQQPRRCHACARAPTHSAARASASSASATSIHSQSIPRACGMRWEGRAPATKICPPPTPPRRRRGPMPPPTGSRSTRSCSRTGCRGPARDGARGGAARAARAARRRRQVERRRSRAPWPASSAAPRRGPRCARASRACCRGPTWRSRPTGRRPSTRSSASSGRVRPALRHSAQGLRLARRRFAHGYGFGPEPPRRGPRATTTPR